MPGKLKQEDGAPRKLDETLPPNKVKESAEGRALE